jgi:NADH dehydrogenase [ubiquinone] 1 alpha subcomplex assembly factor 7
MPKFEMPEFREKLINLIKANGPISISEYMTQALCHPKFGYYMKQDPFGKKGDFTTAPEISQMFGEMIGIWVANYWNMAGKPAKIYLAEMGPGRGTLMQDILRAIAVLPDLKNAAEVHLVEISPALKTIQKECLTDYNITWHDSMDDLLKAANDAPLYLIMNELFDALPIRQFQMSKACWHERMVSITQDETALQMVLMPDPVTSSLVPEVIRTANEGSLYEVCPAGDALIDNIATHIKKTGGAALIIDYGYDKYSTGDTLQALENHKYADIFEKPGDADLTAHVNFKNLQVIAAHTSAKVTKITSQGAFLNQLGIMARAEKLLLKASPQQQQDIYSALNRLLSEDEMGSLFKVLCVHDGTVPEIIGF